MKMIRIYFSKLKNNNLEITEKMLNDILSHMKTQDKEIERLNNILDTLMQDMALLNATGVKEIKPKYVFDRIVMLREGVDKE